MGDVAIADSQTIREAVADLLGVGTDTVDPNADLIAQGLDSIRMMSLAGRWRRHGIDVDFASLAATPTVSAWVELVSDRAAATEPVAAQENSVTRSDSQGAEPFPLAPMQHAMWVGREGDQQLGGVAGHLYVEFDGDGVDPDRLQRAANALADRHPMLRVQFLPDGTQRIGAMGEPLRVTVEDLRQATPEQVAERLAQVVRTKSHQQLHDEVFELTLSLLPGGATRLHVDLDMQAADAMSYRTLMADLAALYNGAQLPELDYTYREYRLASADSSEDETDRDWWTERIPELPDPPRLPVVPAAEQADPHHTTRRHHWLDPETRDALFAAARKRGITPAMALAASFSDALAGWSAEPRFLLNVPLFGREQRHPDVDKLVGDFTSSLLLDIDLRAAKTAAQRARAVQDTFHAAAGHAGYSGLSVLRDLSRHRGTQVLAPVVYTSALGLGELFGSEVTATFGKPVWINSQGPQVLLDAQVTEFDGGVLVNWDVREDAFRPGVIDAMFDRHITELRRLALDDTAWEALSAPLLPQSQRDVRDAANAASAAPTGHNLHQGFFAQALVRPDALAVIGSKGQLSYAELREQALAVAAALQIAGVRPGQSVAVMGPKGPDQIPALLGILAAGAVYVPVGVDQPADRAERMLANADVRMALFCGDGSPTWLPALTVTEALRIGRRADRIEPAPTALGELAYILFTSGSTGEPKGVEVTHDAAMNTLETLNTYFGMGPEDSVLALTHLESDLSVLDVFGTLAAGATIVVVDEADRRNPDHWVEQINTHGITTLNFLPGSLEMLVESAWSRQISMPTIRAVPTGGDWVRTTMVRKLQELSPGVRVTGLGGATETAIHATLFEARDLPDGWTAVPYGKPFPNNACRVVNAAGQDCPDWVPGELWIGGRGLARGYRGQPELTADRFVAYCGRTWYRTGDLARYWPDGTLEFVGRADHRVKISGYRIELGEVEAALQRLSGVHAAVVDIVAGPTGELLAALVAVDDPSRSTAELRSELAELIPPHMVPRHIELAQTIPFTVGGKTDRRAVGGLLTDAAQGAQRGSGRAPETALQRALAAILGELLGVAELGIDEDFFELGGDSVRATAAVARIRDWLDTPTVMVPDVFATRTVEKLGDRLIARETNSDRLEQVAELYMEVADMDDADVMTALDSTSTS
ncbi:amino acid adenylation domain-containing protein [Mycobacterium sp. TNTM28]|uniref:Phenyloxazoline synthase MbtB n=1 Tax=[Mycobacterium] fortunisiensis TaxID=2600579 RepID=A0ABS6KQG0_9MYCO|nr:amino acid adenylation domain-containing protein [[Mycobacterium] fortunisiensis]